MSIGARIMQVLFIVGGLLGIGLGLLSAVLTGSPEGKADWECSTAAQSTTQRCYGSVAAGPAQVPLLLVLGGVGLEIAAAAVSVGGRRAPAVAPTPAVQQRPAGAPPWTG